MAHGFSLTRHDGLSLYAEALAAAGAHVLVFDHRYLGDSGGMPRQRFRRGAQLEDWRNAIAFARTLDGVAAERIVLWGFSFSGGHVVTLAAGRDDIAAAVVLCPFVDGLRRALGTPPALSAWIIPRALADAAGPRHADPRHRAAGDARRDGAAGGGGRLRPRRPRRLAVAQRDLARDLPDGRDRASRAPRREGDAVRSGSASASATSASTGRRSSGSPSARRAGELQRYDADHFDVFLGELPARIAGDQVAFLTREGLL